MVGVAEASPLNPSPRAKRILRLTVTALLGIAALPLLAWSIGALHFDLPVPQPWRTIAAGAWGVGAVLVPLLVRPRRWSTLGVAVGFVLVLACWLTISPSNARDWQPDVARVARATIADDLITIENVRNCEYRTETDYDARWESRSYRLSNLRGVDAFLTTWGSPWMAHPIISFDFGEDGRVCFSIETRKERGETYSAVGGLYRQYELIYVAADERDVVRLRTNFRKGEEVHHYRFTIPLEATRERFLGYIRRINELADSPEFYNAVTDNCTTSIRLQADPGQRQPFDYRMLLNGTIDELLYERGFIDRSVPFEVLKRGAHINARARAADDAPDFSDRVRDPAAVP